MIGLAAGLMSRTVFLDIKYLKAPYVTGPLSLFILTVLIDVRMRTQDVDYLWAPELTGKMKRGFEALRGNGQKERDTDQL